MKILENKLWLSDIREMLDAMPEMNKISGTKVMVTGCTGLICSAIVDALFFWNQSNEKKIHVIAAGRNTERIRNRFSPFDKEYWFELTEYNAESDCNNLPSECDYIIHGAGNASPDKVMKEPVETMVSNFEGMLNLLDYAKETGVKRVLYISSSEVYGRKKNDQPYKSNEYGYIDLLNPRNSYSVAKRATETLCASYADEYGVGTVIVRPGHIYGPTASENDTRVSSSWAYAAAKGEDIVMKSDGAQKRSYCYCLDCASAILRVLIDGDNLKAYNISNRDSVISIREMAELIAKVSGVKLKMELPTETEKKRFNPMNNSSLDSSELSELGWRGLFDAERGFSHTIQIIRDLYK